MQDTQLPTAVWSGTFTLFGVTLKCHVLSTGERIIDADSLALLFEAMSDPNATLDRQEIDAFVRWQRGV